MQSIMSMLYFFDCSPNYLHVASISNSLFELLAKLFKGLKYHIHLYRGATRKKGIQTRAHNQPCIFFVHFSSYLIYYSKWQFVLHLIAIDSACPWNVMACIEIFKNSSGKHGNLHKKSGSGIDPFFPTLNYNVKNKVSLRVDNIIIKH